MISRIRRVVSKICVLSRVTNDRPTRSIPRTRCGCVMPRIAGARHNGPVFAYSCVNVSAMQDVTIEDCAFLDSKSLLPAVAIRLTLKARPHAFFSALLFAGVRHDFVLAQDTRSQHLCGLLCRSVCCRQWTASSMVHRSLV